MKKCLWVLFLSAMMSRTLAHEGMWIPSLLDAVYDDMKAYGLKLSQEDLYSVNHSSLKDAIVLFNGSCTAEIVSSNGLLFTNHHCGYSYIQSHSSVEQDYLTDGFWARDRKEELRCDQLTAMFIVSIEDVTEGMNQGIVQGMSAQEIEKMRAANKKEIESMGEKRSGYMSYVRPFNYGNQFFLMRTKTYSDVRLVGAPPSVIGLYGGDTDNWVWPRHTGDFSVFRIYADQDNEPTAFDEGNKTYEPLHFFPISLDGVKEGDFSMVYGFPGKTEHLLTNWAVEYMTEKSMPMKIHMRETVLRVMESEMAQSDRVRIQYASKQSVVSNAYIKWKGQIQGLEQSDAIGAKQLEEAAFKSKSINEKAFVPYQDVLPALENLYSKNEKNNLAREGFVEYMYNGPEIFAFAYSFEPLLNGYEKLKADGKLDDAVVALKAKARLFYKNLDIETEKKIFSALTPLYVSYVDETLGPMPLKAELMKKGGKEMLIHRMYTKGFFTDSTRVMAFLDQLNPRSFKKVKADPAFSIAQKIFDTYNAVVKPAYISFQVDQDFQMGRYVRAIGEMKVDDKSWLDANSTLRLSFGKVEGSAPRDGMKYTYYTTTEGILEKSMLDKIDFEINPKLEKLYKERNFGVYGENGELHVCYTGSNHTTGGNSGSPALNGKGELVGINFDRSWESTMSDLVYNPEICRNIMVDIRYVLWVIDVYAEADYLLNEMRLIKSSPENIETR